MKKIIAVLLLLHSSIAFADEVNDEAKSAKNEEEQVKLPIRYFSTVQEDELFTKIKSSKRFDNLSKEDLPGAPIALLVTLSSNNTAGGSAASLGSAIWAGSTLGLLPMVTNKDMVVRYEMMVNRKKIVDISFTENFTEAKNLYNAHNQTLDKDVLEWVLSTVPLFKKQLSQNSEFKNLEQEYVYYFES
ncbi:MAG: hypothetical protein OQJ89_07980 [Kangiellaceae bacterium]|nr:hypothetical protein [Kangiellaceae bacterium]MCW8999072.1 hypothetical protein [Kangiellaceae bacterium]MCW9016885.1 hypothetical protein [Kangiellaceae bacterium]